MFGPRGVYHCFATDQDDPTVDPRFGKVGKQKCEDTGPLPKKRMETMDEEITQGALDFMDKAHKDGKPFFVWWNSTRMHVFTHLKPASDGKTGLGIYADGMVEHDGMVGQLLDKLKELGIEDNTIVMYSTDNGAEAFTWPDGGTTMFRGEKNTNWEGGYRVPSAIRWPGVIKPGTVINDIGAHEDMLTTLLAAAGDTTVKEDLLKGRKVGDTTFKVHLDGYNLLPALKGEGGMAAQGVPLLDRRRQRRGPALQQLEGHLLEAERTGHACLDASLRGAARALAHQSPHGSIRAGRAGDDHGLPTLVGRAHVHVRARRGLRRPVAAELPRVPAAPEARQLQSRPRDGSDDQATGQRQVTRAGWRS